MFPRNTGKIVLLLLALNQFGSAVLECYFCTPLLGKCGENFDSTKAIKSICGEGQNACIKLEMYGTFTRGCGIQKVCEQIEGCVACSKNLCNTSSKILSSFTSLGFVTLTIMKYFL